MKIGAGHKPQGYDEHGRYTGPGGGQGEGSKSGQNGHEPLKGVLIADSGRIKSDAGPPRMSPKDYSPVPDHDDGGAAFYKALRFRESSDGVNLTRQNRYGMYQMGEAELRRVGALDASGGWTGKYGRSKAEFLASPEMQEAAIREWHGKVWQNDIKGNRLDQYIGQTVNGTQITKSGLVAGAHLVGGPKLKEFLKSGGAIVPEDGNRVPVTDYLRTFCGYPLPFR